MNVLKRVVGFCRNQYDRIVAGSVIALVAVIASVNFLTVREAASQAVVPDFSSLTTDFADNAPSVVTVGAGILCAMILIGLMIKLIRRFTGR